MTTLEDRLADLADDAPAGEATPGLWERGLSLHRRRRRGTIAIAAAAVVALSVLGVASWRMADADPAPAEPGSDLRLPDRFFTPSKWLPGTDDEGPIGPLVAVAATERAGAAYGMAAVSTTGEYRFLDLPSRAVDNTGGSAEVSLSADGLGDGRSIVGSVSDADWALLLNTLRLERSSVPCSPRLRRGVGHHAGRRRPA